MKKQLSFTSESGFIFPYVIFIISLLLIVLLASIHIYKQESHMTQYHFEQIKMETLVQMGLAAFKNDLLEQHISEDSVTYTFPYGSVLITYSTTEKAQALLLQLTIRTDGHSSYQTSYVMKLPPDDLNVNVDSFQQFIQNPQ